MKTTEIGSQTFQPTYTTFISGDSDFFSEIGIPLAGELKKHLPSFGISQNKNNLDESLVVSRAPTNNVVAIAGVVGIIFFVGSRIAGKIIDDIYIAKIQPKVKEILGQAEKNLTGANARKKKMYWFGVWYAEPRVLVLVTAVGDTFEQILNQNDLIVATHANANSWIEKNGRHKTIHLYLLENGRANVTPILFDSLMEANSYINKQFPFEIPQKLKRQS